MPNWFHFHCFFAKFKASSEADFANFDSIRWEDQEKIRERLNGSSNKVSKSKKKSKGAPVDVVDGPSAIKEAMEFSIEYAKSSRAKCRQCEEKIEKVKLSKKK